MKKREFLAMGGAVPLVLAGCGGNGSGSAPVRLVNASVGYSSLGFTVGSTQAVTGVAYGTASAFVSVDADSETMSLTATAGSSTVSLSSVTRSLNKNSRYSLVGYGYAGELKQVLITETTSTPDSGRAYVYVVNTSADIGAVDVYLVPKDTTTNQTLTKAQRLALATNVTPYNGGVAANSIGAVQSAVFVSNSGIYDIYVIGNGADITTTTDVRFSSINSGSTQQVTLDSQGAYNIILTPGLSGTLANVIFLKQGSQATAPISFVNASARVNAVATFGNTTTSNFSVAGVTLDDSGNTTTIEAPFQTAYLVVPAGAAPAVQVNGTSVPVTGTLTAGADYTLLIYLDLALGTPIAKLIQDDNTAPATSGDIKTRLINLVYNPSHTSTNLSLKVNSLNAGTNSTYASVSPYTLVAVPTGTTPISSQVEVISGNTTIKTRTVLLTQGKTYTEIVAGQASVAADQPDFFSASTGS